MPHRSRKISDGFQKAAHTAPVWKITHHIPTKEGLAWFEDLLNHPKKLAYHFKSHRTDFVEPLLRLAMTEERENKAMRAKARHLLAEALLRPEARGIAISLATENIRWSFAQFCMLENLSEFRLKILCQPGFIPAVCRLNACSVLGGMGAEELIGMVGKYKPQAQAQILKTEKSFSGLITYCDSTRAYLAFALLKKLDDRDQYEILSDEYEGKRNFRHLAGKVLTRDQTTQIEKLFAQLQQKFGPPDSAPTPRAA